MCKRTIYLSQGGLSTKFEMSDSVLIFFFFFFSEGEEKSWIRRLLSE